MLSLCKMNDLGMTRSAEIEMNRLQNNLERMIVLYNNRNEEIRTLQSQVLSLDIELKQKDVLFNELDSKYRTLKLAKSLEANAGDMLEVKGKVNGLVREIDKCIALLNR